MKLCLFNENRLGVVEGDVVIDVTGALDQLQRPAWPWPQHDALIQNLSAVCARANELKADGIRHAADAVIFRSPVANPPKIIAAPVNYLKHQQEANADRALEHVAAYTLGLDMTLRGSEDRSLRKSLDGFSVAGPWLVTADEVPDPDNLKLWLSVNGEIRQNANTADLIFDVRRLIEYASSFYELNPGDLLFTGTPDGVGPVVSGDEIECGIERIGEAQFRILPCPANQERTPA